MEQNFSDEETSLVSNADNNQISTNLDEEDEPKIENELQEGNDMSKDQKKCIKCGTVKNLSEFYDNRNTCKICKKLHQNTKYKISKKNITEAQKIFDTPSKRLIQFSDNIPENNKKFLDKLHIFDLDDISKNFEQDNNHFIFIFLSLINVQFRVQNIPSWCALGKIFCNAFNGLDLGLQFWITLTKAVEELEDLDKILIDGNLFIRSELCEKLYDDYKNITINHLTYRTLAFFAKEDNPKLYDKWNEVWVLEAVTEAVGLVEGKVAKMIYRMLWLDYFLIDDQLFYFNGSTQRLLKNTKMSSNITLKVIPFLENLYSDVLKSIKKSKTTSAEKSDQKFSENLKKLIDKLGKQTFKNFVIQEIKELLPELTFKNIKMDFNNNLLCVNNCTIEKCFKKAYPRNSRPEDFITKQCEVNYLHILDENDIKVKFVRSWIKQMFVHEDSIKQVLFLISSCLFAQEGKKKLPFFVGKPDCGKSLFCQLIMAVFGDYATTLSSTALTVGSINPGGANPELASTKNMRFMAIPETNTLLQICNQIYKIRSSGDRVTARKLYENGEDFIQTGLTVAFMNQIPKFDMIDQATKERFSIIQFIGRYIDNPPTSEDEQIKTNTYKKNTEFSSIVGNYAEAFLWILVKFYREHGNEEYRRSNSDIELSEKFYKTHNIYGKFIGENINKHENSEKSKSILNTNDAYKNFRTWFSIQGYHSVPDKDKFMEGMNEELGMYSKENNGWRGFSIKYNYNI